MRKIPATMATQHPDNANVAYFTNSRFISSQNEIEECYRCFSELNVEEYMWDWEGKFVDEAVIDRLYTQHHEFFQQHQIGQDIFLTFRIPNIWIESSAHKLPRAFMNMISAANAAKTYGFHSPPLFEVILPMTSKPSQLIYLHETFNDIAEATKKIFDIKSPLANIDVIPLFEEFDVMTNAKSILHEYTNYLKEKHNIIPEYLRAFTARSDPALNSGFVLAKLACVWAIAEYHEFEEESGIPIYPWIGAGCLPFRGGISPEHTEQVLDEYQGIGTVTTQSSFRYDYPLDQVKKAIGIFNRKIPLVRSKYRKISAKEKILLRNFYEEASKFYTKTIEKLASTINHIAAVMPSHRERVQHIGLFGYSRGIGQVKLPRAIKFTGSLYSLGIPPELIGTGRILEYAKKTGVLDILLRLCPYIKSDILYAGRYLNKENLQLLIKENNAWEAVKQDIEKIEKIFGIQLQPQNSADIIHRNFTSNVYQRMLNEENFEDDILAAARIRKSLG